MPLKLLITYTRDVNPWAKNPPRTYRSDHPAAPWGKWGHVITAAQEEEADVLEVRTPTYTLAYPLTHRGRSALGVFEPAYVRTYRHRSRPGGET